MVVHRELGGGFSAARGPCPGLLLKAFHRPPYKAISLSAGLVIWRVVTFSHVSVQVLSLLWTLFSVLSA